MPGFVNLIGYPLKHSLSPYFQQEALDYYHLDVCYQAWEVRAEELETAISRLREPQHLGANVTVPYKEAVMPLLDGVDDLAALVGAVNTIVKRDGDLWGYNTDVGGFVEALKARGNFDVGGKRAIVLGAGGSARAVSFALAREKISSLLIANRTPERARVLVKGLRHYAAQTGLEAEITVLLWQALASERTFADCQLVVNCTPVGMKYSSSEGQSPLAGNVIPEGILVYDLVYNPSPSPLLQLSRKAGANILGGLPMLVYQGAASFKLWMGREAPVGLMHDKARQALIEGNK
ncbi:MAG: shikimate dehydrogenase [Dehalococcoidia bacterium]|nr:shikimate dehydrogenase [Dehalococcoidia bacterium]